jgi:hypothetical protein
MDTYLLLQECLLFLYISDTANDDRLLLLSTSGDGLTKLYDVRLACNSTPRFPIVVLLLPSPLVFTHLTTSVFSNTKSGLRTCKLI